MTQRRSVVFDLFHTLIAPERFLAADFDAIHEVAEITALEFGPLTTFWDATYVERETTTIDLVDLVQRHADSCGVGLDDDQRRRVDAVFGLGKDDALRHPDPDVVRLVTAVATGTSIGVLSNCHEREVRCWMESPLAAHVTAFGRSSRIGAMKPDPEAYQWILERLDADPKQSIYVGNGSSNELLGARSAGFGTVVHANYFDRKHGLVGSEEQHRRAAQADATAETLGELGAALISQRGGSLR